MLELILPSYGPGDIRTHEPPVLPSSEYLTGFSLITFRTTTSI
uniref:Uncharacterized protein n=1 Tax=Arundo donax TaxID=35708 RepID=A0A0A9F4C2_ARUDO